METTIARVFLGIIVGAAAILAVLGIVSQLMKARRERKAEEARRQHPWDPEPSQLERDLIDRVADAHGFEYAHYWLTDRFGNRREAWCRIVPTTIAFSCPDCGGMVVGVDAPRVWPGTTGPDPELFRCEQCGRQEDHEFGVPRVFDREGDPVFTAPRGVQSVCPRGGKHQWVQIDQWFETKFPDGVDACAENLCFAEEVWHQRLRCEKCGEVKTT